MTPGSSCFELFRVYWLEVYFARCLADSMPAVMMRKGSLDKERSNHASTMAGFHV